ncbi:FTR1 family protein [Polymorphobacter sp. PAMC 29334]|uniref:FTR1 family protein n=1 Tax=Polymorphobacter sp. PAMC 29334 TaxID=2862331 RepID=UPI00351D3A5E
MPATPLANWRTAMFATLIVAFREGTEAFLIVAVAAAYLRRTGRTRLMRPLWSGVAIAIVGSVILGALLVSIGGLGSLWEGWLALVAVALVLSCTIHLLRHGRTMKATITGRIDLSTDHTGNGAALGVFLFALLMIGREGSEAAAMIASLVGQVDGTTMIIGGIGGLLLAVALGSAWIRYGRAVDLTLFFNATAVFMVLFSLQLGIYALHEFAEASALPWIDNAEWHMATEPYGPDGEWGRLLSYSLVVAPALLIGWARIRAIDTRRRIGAFE